MAYTTIKKPSDYFNTKLYTGNLSTNNITGVGFQPDLVWLKSRTQGTTGYNGNHYLFDAVRGATKWIISNQTGAEANNASSLSSFDSDGFTLGGLDFINNNGDNFVGWNWKANGQGSSNTDGSTNTIYTSVNTTAGLSISSYTGTGNAATIGHGLGVAPKMIIIKRTSDSDSWTVGHNSLGWGKFLRLDTTAAESSNTSTWNNTAPTSSVFSVNHADTNDNNRTFIAYCFADVTGYSKFGSYTGNGNADGTFVYTGFKPAMIMIKNTTGNNWGILDNKRDPSNGMQTRLHPNLNSADNTGAGVVMDFLSNGFKPRTNDGLENPSAKVIYMAFAEEPLIGDNPATAR